MSSSLTVSPGAVVCNESKLLGEVSIGARTVVHPKATIIAETGPIIEEQAVIINARNPDATSDTGVVSVMIIGNNNVFEVGCRSSALKIGDNNVLESKCFVGRSVVLSNGCIVGAGCRYVEPYLV